MSPHQNISKKTELVIFISSIIIQVLCIILFADGKLIYLLGAISLIVFFIYTFFSVEKIFLLLAFYIAAFPMLEYLGNFPGLIIGFSWKIAYPLFALLIIYWSIYLLTHRENFLLNRMDIAIIIYLVIMSISGVSGFLRGYDRKIFLYDFLPIPFFLGYFIFLYSPLRNKLKKYYDFLLAIAIFVSFQFIYAVVNYKSLFFLGRIVSEHIHIAQLAIPYIIATLIFSTSRTRKILFSFPLLLVISGVIISQQRSLYAATSLTIVFLTGVFLYTRRVWIKNNLSRFATYITAACLLIVAITTIIQIITRGKFLTTLNARFFIFLNLEQLSADTSWKGRWREINHALKGLKHFWFFGQGFGASHITRFRFTRQFVLDQSYLYLIWKTGVIGLLSLLYMYFTFFTRNIKTLRKKITNDEKIFLITALFNAAGMILIAFANVSIAHFRLLFIWGALFASTEIIARKYTPLH